MTSSEMDVASKKLGGWPHLLDMTKAECRKTLRALELAAYSQSVAVLRAQGELTKEKRKLLNDLQAVFSITLERHRAEIRKAVNDEKLNTIAETLAGPNTGVEWAVEGRRLVPLMPRVPPQTAYTALATRMAMLYYGINEKVPHPATTAHYGKMDDLGAESDDTDSEEETEGLRYISQPMVPHQYNADQGSYTTLPHSQARQARMTSKENRENREAPVTSSSAAAVGPSSAMVLGTGSGGIPGSMNTSSSSSGSGCLDKRKRKRSSSTDHPSLPPPSPAGPQQQQLLHQPTTPTKQNPGMGRSMGGGQPMKITVTGNVTRSIPGTPVSTFAAQHTQKVILVSTSGASGVGGSLYQRSMSVPMIKNPNSGPPPQQPPQALMRGMPPTAITATSTIQSVSHVPGGIMVPSTYTSSSTGNITANAHPPPGMAPGTYVSRMRPRAPSGPSMPPRPRQRSNSLVLNTEPIINPRGLDGIGSTIGGGSSSMSNCGSSSNINSSGINSGSLCSTSSSTGPGYASSNTGGQGVLASLGTQHAPGIPQPHLLQHQTIQVRPGTPVTPGKTAIQIRQEGAGAKIITHSVAGSGNNNNNNLMNSNSGVGNNLVGTGVLAGAANTGSGGPNGRMLGRPPLPVPSTITQQGPPPGVGGPPGGPLYVVTTNSGTITVVTRTVAAGHGMRAAAPAAVVSVGPKTVQTVRVTPQGAGGLRPMLGGTKSNVIVVHKGAPHPGAVTRPISSIPTIREAPTKITIGKPVSSSGPAMLGKQVPGGGGMRMGPPHSGIPGSTANTGPMVSAAQQSGNVIVVDMSQDQQAAAAATVAAVSVNSNSLADLLNASGESNLGSVTVSSAIASSSVPSSISSHSSSEGMSMARASILNCAGVNSTAQVVSTAASGGGSSGAMEGEWMAAMEEEEEGEEQGTDHSLPEGQMQMLEEAVEILGRGDKESARNLLRQAGIELLDSPGDMDQHGFSSVQ